MMRHTLTALTFVFVLLVSSHAFAQLRYANMGVAGESEVSDLVEIRLGGYRPSIDDEFGGEGPWSQVFAQRRRLMYEIEYDRQLWRGFGSFAIGLHLGWYRIEAASLTEAGDRSTDRTQFSAVPVRASAVYRFDVLHTRFNIPFAISAKAGLSYHLWWVNDEGSTSVVVENGNEVRGSGGTAGVHWGLGLHLLLDWFAPDMARAFDANVGVNNSYLFVEYFGTKVNDFGSAESWDLSDNQLLFGLAFEF